MRLLSAPALLFRNVGSFLNSSETQTELTNDSELLSEQILRYATAELRSSGLLANNTNVQRIF